MNKKCLQCFALIICSLVLSGCWDQMILNDVDLIYSIGVDKRENGELEATVSIPYLGVSQEIEPKGKIVSGIGKTLRDTRINIDNTVSGLLDSSKIRMIIIHEDLAKIDLYAMLDLYYRDPRAPLASRIIISESPAKEMINLNIEGIDLISEYFYELIDAAERNTVVPKLNLQYVCPLMLDVGKDFHLPLAKIVETDHGDRAQVIGTALFNGKKMTGTLNVNESVMANLLNNDKGKNVTYTIETTDEDKELSVMKNITVQIDDYERQMTVKKLNNQEIEVDVTLTLYLNATEYPPDAFSEMSKTKELNEKLQEEFNSIANSTVMKLQESQCDLLGIGREVIAYHNGIWRNIEDWKQVYSTLPINVTVNAEIIRHGIIN